MSAFRAEPDNLVAIVDVNGLGQSGPAPYHHDTGVFVRRFEGAAQFSMLTRPSRRPSA
jgi:hypothetical protein